MFNVLIASGKTKAPRPVGGAVASMVAHGALLTALLLGSRPAIHAATEFEERIAQFLFPKDRAPVLDERARSYFHTPGGGTESASNGANGKATGLDETRKPHDPLALQLEKPEGGTASTPDATVEEQKMAESMGAFALLDVDSGAVRDPRSAAPVYPKELEAKGIEGTVRMRFVIDSTGFIDPSTVTLLQTSNDAFVSAVKAALPNMLFRPAMVGAKAVRQLAEQEFQFKVQVKRDTAPPKKPQ